MSARSSSQRPKKAAKVEPKLESKQPEDDKTSTEKVSKPMAALRELLASGGEWPEKGSQAIMDDLRKRAAQGDEYPLQHYKALNSSAAKRTFGVQLAIEGPEFLKALQTTRVTDSTKEEVKQGWLSLWQIAGRIGVEFKPEFYELLHDEVSSLQSRPHSNLNHANKGWKEYFWTGPTDKTTSKTVEHEVEASASKSLTEADYKETMQTLKEVSSAQDSKAPKNKAPKKMLALGNDEEKEPKPAKNDSKVQQFKKKARLEEGKLTKEISACRKIQILIDSKEKSVFFSSKEVVAQVKTVQEDFEALLPKIEETLVMVERNGKVEDDWDSLFVASAEKLTAWATFKKELHKFIM